MHTPLKVSALMAAVMLSGCATFSADGGFSSVQKTAQDKLGKNILWAQTEADKNTIQNRVQTLVSAPLTIEAAVEIALLNNPGLQADYHTLGIAESAVVAAGRLPNPHLAMMRASHLDASGREYKIEQTLTFNLFSLLTKPQEYAIAKEDFRRTQLDVSTAVLRLAHETRKAWVDAVAAQESSSHFRRAKEASFASAELARRMAQVGNINALAHAREHSQYAETTVALARAELHVAATREHLAQLLGLDSAQFPLPDRLPDLPADLPALQNLERQALAERLDLAAVRLDTELLGRRLGLTRTTRFINVLEIGPARVLEGPRDAAYKTGYEIAFDLPLFDWGGARVAGAKSRYERQLNLAAQTAIEARSQVRLAAKTQRTTFDIARHYRDEILPLSKRIAEENLLRYNGMLIGTLDLLADTRARIATVTAALNAQREFWLAQADLDMALIGNAAPAKRTPATLQTNGAAAH